MKKTLFFLFLLVLVFSVASSVDAQSIDLTEEQIAEIQAALDDNSKELPVKEEFRVQVSPDDLSVAEGLDDEWFNILLLGTDTGSYSLNYGRTDTMIILSVNRQTGKMRLSSLIRDMQVNIPYHNRPYRINAANAFGGPLLAIKTVNETFGLNIRHYMSINFNGFIKVIDSLGGVELELMGGEAAIVGLPYKKGEKQLLNGEQALNYVRIRKLDDNFGRNERQRKLLSSLFTKMLNESTMQQAMPALIESLKHISTNLNVNDMLTLIDPVFSHMNDMDTAGFPVQGDYHGETTQGGEAVIVFDRKITTEKLHNYIYHGIFPE